MDESISVQEIQDGEDKKEQQEKIKALQNALSIRQKEIENLNTSILARNEIINFATFIINSFLKCREENNNKLPKYEVECLEKALNEFVKQTGNLNGLLMSTVSLINKDENKKEENKKED